MQRSMEPDLNPYASPSSEPVLPTPIPVAVDVDAELAMPSLPLTFHPSPLALIVMAPIGAFFAAVTVVSVMETASPKETISYYNDGGNAIKAFACALLAAFPAFGCLMVLRCRVVVTESWIEKTDYFKQTIYFTEVVSWHHHPVTKTVYVSLLDSDSYLPISNWAMSPEDSEMLGLVMRAKVGPPSG